MSQQQVDENATTMAAQQPRQQQLMYLPKDLWSPRYDSNFFSVQVLGKRKMTESEPLPAVEIPPQIDGKTNLPAYYYEAVVFREHNRTSLWRRYSHFKWLYEQLVADPPLDEQPPDAGQIRLPPGTCPFQWQDEAFAQNRLEQLGSFLDDVLGRPGYASHPASLAFLELNN